MASDDPEFERKAADIIGLYLNPPLGWPIFHARRTPPHVALDRLDPVLPNVTWRSRVPRVLPSRTQSLYAALNVRSGKIHGKTAARHTSDEVVDFLHQVVGLCKHKQEHPRDPR